jgi:hypothetical protein
MHKLLILGLVFVLGVMGGCASGPKFGTVEAGLVTIPSGKARIYFYRATALGGAIQPNVSLNGTVVGKAEPHGIYYVDHDPGNMEVVTGSEVEKKLTFTIIAGEVRYVKLSVGLGVLVYRIIPELVSAEDAKPEIADLAYTGGNGAK